MKRFLLTFHVSVHNDLIHQFDSLYYVLFIQLSYLNYDVFIVFSIPVSIWYPNWDFFFQSKPLTVFVPAKMLLWLNNLIIISIYIIILKLLHCSLPLFCKCFKLWLACAQTCAHAFHITKYVVNKIGTFWFCASLGKGMRNMFQKQVILIIIMLQRCKGWGNALLGWR